MKIKRLGLGFSAVALALSATVVPLGSAWADDTAAGGSGVTINNLCGEVSDTACVSTLVDFKAALANATFATIELRGNIEADSMLKVDRAVTLDLNGYTLSYSNKNIDLFDVTEKGALTVKDGSAEGTGKIEVARNAVEVNGGVLTVEGGTIKSTGEFAIGLFESGSIYVKGGVIEALYTPIGGNNTMGDMNTYISGGKIVSANNATAIYMPSQVNLEISGGEITGSIVVRMGQIKVSGGTIYSTMNIDAPEEYLDYSGSAWFPGVFNILAGSYKSDNETYGNSLNVEITGGKFVARSANKYANAVAIYDVEKLDQEVRVEISGGEFDTKEGIIPVTVYSREDVLGEGKSGAKKATIDVEITGGVYSEVQDVDIAEDYEIEKNADGNTIVVLKNVDLSGAEGISSSDTGDDAVAGDVKFFKSLVADRKATLKIKAADTEDLTVDAEKAEAEVVAAFEIGLFDRNNVEIEVKDNEVIVYVSLTKEQYETLSKYDSAKVLYFDENGEEKERLDAAIYADEDVYTLSFKTTHFSTYAVAGVNDEGSGEAAPNTGMFTAQSVGASEVAMTSGVMALISTAIVMYGAVKFAKN